MSKKLIVFACQWNKRKEKTWSGTSFAIYRSLKKLYQIEDFTIRESISDFLVRHFFLLLGFSNRRTLELKTIKKNNLKFATTYGNREIEVFQFSECPYTEGTINNIYIDLSISYLLYIKNRDSDTFSETEFDGTSNNKLMERLKQQNIFFESCHNIFTMSQWLHDFLVDVEKIDAKKVHCVGAGINVDLSKRKQVKKTQSKILFVGRNFRRKGGFLVYEAFCQLRKELGIDAELYIAGPKKNPIKGKQEGIHFWGDVSEDQLANLYNICDILCVPSYFEAYGLVFSEALCFGLPCIGRNAYAMPERIEHQRTGYLIQDDDVEQLADYMRDLLQNTMIYDEVKARETLYINEYSWDRVAEKITQFMDR